MLKVFFTLILSILSLSAFSAELPEYLETLLERSNEYFEVYAQKSPAEIDDGSFDDSDRMLFAQVDQVNGLDMLFSKEDIKSYRIQLVIHMAQKFDSDQLRAITRIGKHPKLNKKKAAKYFEAAREFKDGELKEKNIYSEIEPRFFF